MRKRSMFLAAGAVLATVGLTVSSAVADPVGPPTFRAVVGVGSDTTQGVMNALSDVITLGGTKVLGSYDASGSATITTRDPAVLPGCTINRPVGSGNGINALLNSQNSPEGSGGGCLDFARSSNNDSAARPGTNLVYVPFATDGLTYATRQSTTVPKSLSTAQLQNLYNCVAPPPVGTFQPMLPQFGSGTRAFFLSKLGIPNTADIGTPGNRPCVKTTDANGNPLLENTCNLLTAANQLVPYSTASFIAQQSREVPDVHGTCILGEWDGVVSLLLNPAGMVRDVYNVMPKGYLILIKIARLFLGSNSLICTNVAAIQKQGFATNPNCGDTTIQSSGPALTPTTTTLDPLTAGTNQTVTARVPVGVHGWIWITQVRGGVILIRCIRINVLTGVASTTLALNSGDSVTADLAPDNAIQVNGSTVTAPVP